MDGDSPRVSMRHQPTHHRYAPTDSRIPGFDVDGADSEDGPVSPDGTTRLQTQNRSRPPKVGSRSSSQPLITLVNPPSGEPARTLAQRVDLETKSASHDQSHDDTSSLVGDSGCSDDPSDKRGERRRTEREAKQNTGQSSRDFARTTKSGTEAIKAMPRQMSRSTRRLWIADARSLFRSDDVPSWVEGTEHVFRDNSGYDASSRSEIVLGMTNPISSLTTRKKHNEAYFDAAYRLYMEDVHAPHRAMVLQRINELNNLPADEKIAFRNSLLRNLLWKMTPNQRQALRDTFSRIYGDATLGDEINWLYFDTVIRLYTKSDQIQKKLMEKVVAAPEETRLAERDKLMDIIHSHLTKDDRAKLKQICKARYDEVVNSRDTILQVAIHEKKWAWVMQYLRCVLEYAPADQRLKLLEARADNPNGKGQGDAAFSRLLIDAPMEVVRMFMEGILYTTRLTLMEKFTILNAVRLTDFTPAFQMLTGAGHTKRAILFMETLDRWNAPDPYDVVFLHETIDMTIPVINVTYTGGPYTVKGFLIQGYKPDLLRDCDHINAYTRAYENCHKKCARKIKHYMGHHIRLLSVFRFSARQYNPLLADTDMPRRAAWSKQTGAEYLRELAALPLEELLRIDAEDNIEADKIIAEMRKNPPRTWEENSREEKRDYLELHEVEAEEYVAMRNIRAREKRWAQKIKKSIRVFFRLDLKEAPKVIPVQPVKANSYDARAPQDVHYEDRKKTARAIDCLKVPDDLLKPAKTGPSRTRLPSSGNKNYSRLHDESEGG